MSAKDISEDLECDPDTVEAALPRMFHDKYVSKWPNGRHPKWWVGEMAGQLFLPGLQLISEGEKTPLTALSATAAANSSAPLNAVVVRDSEGEIPPQMLELRLAFRAAGIGSNAWSMLEKFDHITPEFVKGHDAYRRYMGESVGLMITRLKCGDEVPAIPGRKVAGDDDPYRGFPAPTLTPAAAPADGPAPVADVEEEDEIDPLPVLWSAICDRVIARDPELFTECLAHVRAVSLAAGVLVISMPVRFYRTFLANEKSVLAMVADVLDEDLVRIDVQVWGVR
jgi:hypothetical protein